MLTLSHPLNQDFSKPFDLAHIDGGHLKESQKAEIKMQNDRARMKNNQYEAEG